jgi:hypothetical protein
VPKVRTEAERQADRKADLWAGRAVVVDVVVVVGFSWGRGRRGRLLGLGREGAVG